MAALREEQDRELAQEDDAEGMMYQQTQWEEETDEENEEDYYGEGEEGEDDYYEDYDKEL